MGASSAIEWTESTWNPVAGCSKVSPGCAHCYAETISLRFGRSVKPWTPTNAAENVVLHPERIDQPRRWRRPRMIFVNSMSDLFHELVPTDFVESVFAVMGDASQHTYQVLTKRPERAAEVLSALYGDADPLPNVWMGASIENARFTWRADVLREIPAAVRFISAEPLLGSLLPSTCGHRCFPMGPPGGSYVCGRVAGHTSLHSSRYGAGAEWDANHVWIGRDTLGRIARPLNLTSIDWLIAGGESGAHYRPVDVNWVRELRDACSAASTAFFFKQWGGRSPKAGGRDLDGLTYDEMPVAA